MIPVEPISLSFSAIALASLFSTCIQCFEYFESAKSQSKDFRLLTIKISIQKTILLKWGESVGLIKNNESIEMFCCKEIPSYLLDVEELLQGIRARLEDAEHLTKRYCLQEAMSAVSDLHPKRHLVLNPITLISLVRARRADPQRRTSAAKKTRWAVHDKAKFESLISDLRELTNGLEQIAKPGDVQRRRGNSGKAEMRAEIIADKLCRMT